MTPDQPQTRILHVSQMGSNPLREYVYIGRPSQWGNPFVLRRERDRPRVIFEYARWIVTQTDLMERMKSLLGKDLCCWCKTEANPSKLCHGDVILDLLGVRPVDWSELGLPNPWETTVEPENIMDLLNSEEG